MTALQHAECLFDEAERETQAAKIAANAHRDTEAQRHYQRVRECQQRAHLLLDQVARNRPGFRDAG
jgi:hypothetical protein